MISPDLARLHLFLYPWQFVSQFSTISKKNGAVRNPETKIITFYYIKSGNFSFRVPPEAPFYCKFLIIGIRSVQDIRIEVSVFQVLGSAPAPTAHTDCI